MSAAPDKTSAAIPGRQLQNDVALVAPARIALSRSGAFGLRDRAGQVELAASTPPPFASSIPMAAVSRGEQG